MSDNKKYYWLKLKYSFFNQKEIKKMRQLAGGDTFTIIYLKMQLKSLENDCSLFYDGIDDDFEAELALDIDEKEDNVRIVVAYLLRHGFMELSESEDGAEYRVHAAKENTGVETQSAIRVRRHRAKKQKALQCNNDVIKRNTEIEKDKELETELELENNKDPLPQEDIYKLFETWKVSCLTAHSLPVLKRNIKKKHQDIIKEIGLEQCTKAVKNYSVILNGADYWYSHKFTYWDFICRGINNFTEEMTPLENYRKNKQGKPPDALKQKINDRYKLMNPGVK